MDTALSNVSSPTSPIKPTCNVFVRTLMGSTISIAANLTDSVAQFAERVADNLGVAVDLSYNGKPLAAGSLASNGVADNSSLDCTVSMRAGREMLRNAPLRDVDVQSIVNHVASLLRPGSTTPVSLSFEHGDQTVTVTVEPSTPAAAPSTPAPPSPPPSHTSPMDTQDGDDEVDASVADDKRRRVQEMVNAAQDDARAARQRTSEIKRTATTMAALQARMKARKLARDRKMHPNAASPPPPPPAPTFAGMRRGFLSAAAPSTPAAPCTPARSPVTTSSASAPAVPAKPRPQATFGGMRRGFLG